MRLPSRWAGPVLAAALAIAGCSPPCQELGNLLCTCRNSSTDRATCERAVKDELARLKPTKDEESFCDEKLKACKAPDGIDFCTWLDGADGKIACGIAYPAPSTP